MLLSLEFVTRHFNLARCPDFIGLSGKIQKVFFEVDIKMPYQLLFIDMA